MVNIKYRHFQPGDEEQLADLFNRAFQMNGGGFVRTPKTWIWRYLNSPGFEPEQCQLAEDVDNNKLVGAIYVNLIEKIPINKKELLVGDINDVSCHPDYTGRGIAKNLMDMSVKYMKQKGCDISMLTADYNGFPRKKIYLKYGYTDIDREFIFFNTPNILKIVKDLPAISILFPVLFSLSYLPRFINRVRIKCNPFFKSFSYEIVHNQKHFLFMQAANQIVPKQFYGFPKYDLNKIKWARIKVPAKRHEPTYIIVKHNDIIIGGATLTHQNMYSFKYGVKFRIGIIHEIFLDESEFNNRKNLHFGYIYLVDKLMKAATRRNIGALYLMIDSRAKGLANGLRAMGFIKILGGVSMIKIMREGLELLKEKKPLFVPTYVSTGVP
ncbi:MAG: GNAT family N-acetyltransferase [Promethearchaeota archaeon]